MRYVDVCLSQLTTVTACQLHLNFGFYKTVRAFTVILHVYGQFEIDYMGNKTFLSFILTISKTTSSTFTKFCCFNSLARWYQLCNIVRTHPCRQSETLFRPLDKTRLYEVLGAKETRYRLCVTELWVTRLWVTGLWVTGLWVTGM